jgi:hypothetical protein
LVGYHKQLEPDGAQTFERLFNAVFDFEFREIPRRSGPPVPENRLINYPIAIEKDGPLRKHHPNGRAVTGSYVGLDRYIPAPPIGRSLRDKRITASRREISLSRH